MRFPRFALVLIALLTGCLLGTERPPADTQDTGVEIPDWDGDGFGNAYYGGTDCDDGDPDIYPGAPEYCDHYDHDCDGETHDDDAVDPYTWYIDVDGDGHGNPDGKIIEACLRPDGFSNSDRDCDDTDPNVSGGERESCDDDIDNDCDGLTDDQDPEGCWDAENGWWESPK